jgi:hypothetical protein
MYNIILCRSQWPHGLRHKPSSPTFLHHQRCGGQLLVRHCPGTAKSDGSAVEQSHTKDNITMALARRNVRRFTLSLIFQICQGMSTTESSNGISRVLWEKWVLSTNEKSKCHCTSSSSYGLGWRLFQYHSHILHISQYVYIRRNTVAARSRAWTVFARSNTGVVSSSPTQGTVVCVRLFCVYVVPCVDSGLATGWSPVQGVLMTVYRIKKLKKRPMSKGL